MTGAALAERMPLLVTEEQGREAVGVRLYNEVSKRIDETYNLAALLDPACEVTTSNELIYNARFAGVDAVGSTALKEVGDSNSYDLVRRFQMLEAERETGSFKEQGAFLACLEAVHRSPIRTFVAFSAGNHGLGVARFVNWYNQLLIDWGHVRVGVNSRILPQDRHLLAKAHIFCRGDASPSKTAPIVARGKAFADVVLHQSDRSGRSYETLEAAKRGAERFCYGRNRNEPDSAFLAHPFADTTVMAGAANTSLSAVVQARAQGVDVANVPLVLAVAGGGLGLANGSGVMLDKLIGLGVVHPESRVVVSQMEQCDSAIRGIARLDQGITDMDGLFVENGVDVFTPAADGTAVKVPHVPNLELARYLRSDRNVMDFIRVSKGGLGQEMHRAAEAGLIKEPAGALAGAALRSMAVDFLAYDDGVVLVDVVSGGNCSQETQREFAWAAYDTARADYHRAYRASKQLGGVAMLSAAVPRTYVWLPGTRKPPRDMY